MSDDGGNTADPCAAEYASDYSQALSIGAVFIILAASVLGTGLPLLFKRYPKLLVWPFAIVIGKHIGTGVLLALAIIHLYPPAYDYLSNPCLPSGWQSYSYAPLFVLLSAIVMHFIEVAVLEYTVYRKQDHTHSHSHGPTGGSAVAADTEVKPQSYGALAYSSSTSKFDKIDGNDKAEVVQMSTMENGGHIPTGNGGYQDPAALKAELQANAARTRIGEVHDHHNPPSLLSEHAGHSHGILLSNAAERTVGAYILEFGLTAHSIIIGITLGVSGRTDQQTLIPALTFHQFFEGFALGARLSTVGFNSFNEILLTCIYSFSAPLGIAIGIGISNSYNGNSTTALITQGVFDSISAGILLYVSFVQMLGIEFPQDFKSCGRNYWKKFAMFAGMYVGAAVMAIIGKWL